MRLNLKDNRLMVTGVIPNNTVWAKIKNLNEMFYRGQIIEVNEKDGRYEIAGQSLDGKPVIKQETCQNCTQIWQSCNTCYMAMRDKQWFILPEGATVDSRLL